MQKYILLAILLLPLCNAAYDSDGFVEIFNGWVPQATNFSADGQLFFMQNNPADRMTVAVGYDGNVVVINDQECEESGVFVFCYDDTRIWEYSEQVDKVVDQFKIRVKHKVPKIEFTRRTVSTEVPYAWEEVEIVTRFSNTGILDVREITFSEWSSDLFTIIKASTCTHNSTHVWWTGQFPQGRSIECTYTIRPKNATSISTAARIVFWDRGKQLTVTSPSLQMSVKTPLINLSSWTSAGMTARLGEEIRVEFIIANNDPDEFASITGFEISPPKSSRIIKRGRNLELEKGVARWSGKIAPEAKVRLNVTYVPERSGDNSVEGKLVYFVKGIRLEKTLTEPLDVLTDNISVILRQEEGATEGSRKLKLLVVNHGESDQFKDISINVTSPLKGIQGVFTIERLSIKNHVQAFDLPLDIPMTENASEVIINAVVDYATLYGERFQAPFELSIPTLSAKTIEEIEESGSAEDEEVQQPIIETVDTKRTFSLDREKLKIVLSILGGMGILFVLIFSGIKIFHHKKGYRLKEELLSRPGTGEEDVPEDRPIQSAHEFMDQVEEEVKVELDDKKKSETTAEQPVQEKPAKRLKKSESFRF